MLRPEVLANASFPGTFRLAIRPVAKRHINSVATHNKGENIMSSNNKSGLEIANENEIKVLNYLHKFGWLRSKDIASLVWQIPDKKFSNFEPEFKKCIYTKGGLRMAQITLKRLKLNKLVLSAEAPDNSTIYALSQKGANRLGEAGIESISGKDLIRIFSFDQYRHRVISNEIAIAGVLQGFKVFTERQIAQNKWLFNEKGYHEKKPDCLIINRASAWWIEVEKSRKNKKDYEALLNWLGVVHQHCKRPHEKPELAGLGLRKIVFICSPVFEKRLMNDLMKLGWDEESIYLRLAFEKSIFSFRQAYFL